MGLLEMMFKGFIFFPTCYYEKFSAEYLKEVETCVAPHGFLKLQAANF